VSHGQISDAFSGAFGQVCRPLGRAFPDVFATLAYLLPGPLAFFLL